MFSPFTDRRLQTMVTSVRTPPVVVGPETVPGLALWLKADAIVGFNDGDNLTSWVSSEGQAYNFTKPGYIPSPPQYKVNIVNGKPVARHVGSGDIDRRLSYVSTAFYLTSPTLFVVMAWKTATPGLYRRGPGCRPAANTGYGIGRTLGNEEYNTALVGIGGGTAVGTHGVGVAEPAAEQNGVFHVAELARTAGSGWGYYTNGVQSGGFSSDVSLATGVGDDPFSTCLYYDTGTTTPDGISREDIDVAEIVLFDHALTAGERTFVRQYLGTKYNIAVV